MNASGIFPKQLSLLLTLIICAMSFAGCNASPTTPLSLDGKEPLTHQIEIVLLGTKTEASVDSQGKLSTYFESSSNDGKISLSINKDTTLLDKNGKPLSFIEATVVSNPPPPPEDAHIVGAVYDLKPQGATFNPPLKLTLSYDPEQVPEGARESDVYILPYDDDTGWGRWHYKNVDTKNHRVTTQISYLAKHAVLVPKELTSSKPPPKPSPQPDLTSISLGQALSSGNATLAEFGRGICIPCKAMKPILEELAAEYQGRLNVVIVEIDEHPDLTKQYGIMAIPTQIFFDSSGKEVNRHMGFWAKEEIIAQLKKMGI